MTSPCGVTMYVTLWSEAARSISITANYDHKAWRNQRVAEPEFFAGNDLLQLEIKSLETSKAARKTLQASFFPTAAPLSNQEPQENAPSVIHTSERQASEGTQSSSVVVLADRDTHEGIRVSVISEKHDEQTDVGIPSTVPRANAGETLPAKSDGQNEASAAKEPDENSTLPISPTQGASPVEILQGLSPGVLSPVPGPFGTVSVPAGPIDSSRRDVHVGFECDVCQKAPIVGVRWECPVCKNYDLCDECPPESLPVIIPLITEC